MLHISWPEDGLKQRPKHVVSLNKNNINTLCCDLLKNLYSFCILYKHNGDGTTKDNSTLI
jgi:hypothetical protein